ncbi:VapC toxin family PIN domain ribonuclease [Kytococcus schroeteri]|uniref:Ribonuclease VapC n=1 Tax=Kytococcus schroeteri TaxID=138300 RepID=A0A2I1PAT8_9MICO|nr:PIN domain-containing protein [Kytococcus schroeteri]PKZ41744.1 VapC toxin family PIN domain ribonuclease [Kytococcus schroeteri]
MNRHLLDASTLLLAVGAEHPLKNVCQQWLLAGEDQHVRLEASVEVGQEYLFHRTRRVGATQAAREFEALEELVVWHPFDQEILRRTATLVATGTIGGRDAVHAATALAAGFTEIVSADRDFDRVPGLTRRAPDDLPTA